MMDSDDEVRDRATFYMNVLQQKQKALNAAYIFNGEMSSRANDLASRVRGWAISGSPPFHHNKKQNEIFRYVGDCGSLKYLN